ncbi:superoxide dismutase family protein [Kordia sp. YSTF-M3]|uniref:Superoxide dismutase family protein n=1 Tax=Kordia aestuariivivens TaxID=2759037 RepID=A0ABR7Q5N7_9FLAO|nr:superoxide dismutase family protein [Kordia aestuariivivens]MBC8753855.1 superoxide dismutase family protein [Kordia aestuariivivens]
MRKGILIAASALLMLSVSCKGEKKEETPKADEKKETVVPKTTETKKIKFALEPKSDSKVSGRVVFTEKDGVVKMSAIMEGLTEGTHAIHIHEKADCSSPDGKSTGGHWNPTAQPHGKWGVAEGYHKGDIGNFEVKADGLGTVTFSTDQWCIGCGDETKDIVGKAIIVHQGTDDFVSQPSGAAGARVSCGGIIQ